MAAVTMTAIAGATVSAAASAAGTAHAATITPQPAAYQVIADTAHGHLFISEGSTPSYLPYPADTAVLVTDLSGNPVATLPGPVGVHGVTLSPDGTTLYVGQDGGVAAFSTVTLQQTSFYTIGFPAYSVAVQSGHIWVGYGQIGSFFSVGSIDLSTGSFDPASVPYTWISFPPLISADPAGGSGILVTSSEGITPPTVATFNVSVPAAVTQVASTQSSGSCQLPNGLAVVPGGAAVVCNGTLYSTADLSFQASYPEGPVVAAADDGTVAVATAQPQSGPDTFPDLYVVPPGAAFGSYKAAFALETPTAAIAALAWPAGSTNLYAIIQDTDTAHNPLSFTVQALDTRAQTTLTLTGPASGTAHGSVTLAGELTTLLTGAQSALPGAQVTITRTISGAGWKQAKTLCVITADDGTFTVTDALPVHGTYTYTAKFTGDAANAPAANAVVTIAGRPGQ
jgi:hypothetical protein